MSSGPGWWWPQGGGGGRDPWKPGGGQWRDCWAERTAGLRARGEVPYFGAPAGDMGRPAAPGSSPARICCCGRLIKMVDNHGGPHMYMEKLNEHCQRNNLQLEYPDIDATGPPHDRIFTVAVEIKRQYSQGKGKSKKEARENAAALAWEIIEQEKQGGVAGLASKTQGQPLPPPSPPPPSQAPLPAANILESPFNYIFLLNEYTLRNKKVVQYTLESKGGPDHMPIFSYSCKIDGKVLGVGKGNSKQTAKLNAAKMTYEKLTGQTTSRIEKNATPTNSSTNSLSCNFHGSPKEACLNGSECKSMADKLTNQMHCMHLKEPSSSSLGQYEKCLPCHYYAYLQSCPWPSAP